MKDFKFYPMRLLILIGAIGLVPLIGYVYDVHIPSTEEIFEREEEDRRNSSDSYEKAQEMIREFEKNWG